MNNKNEGLLAIISSILLLFTAMIDPIISVALSIILLASFGIFKLIKK